MEKIEKVFERPLQKGEASPLVFTPKGKDKMIIGLLFSSGLNVSLAFCDGTDLILNSQTAFHSPHFAPDKRIIKLQQLLKGTVKGMVEFPEESLQNDIDAKVYFILKQE